MANVKISELNPLLTVQDADVLPIVDNGVTKKVTAAILQSYTQGNSVLLTGAQTIAGIKTFTSQLASTVATGTAPFSVASTTKVTNLNADLLDGLSSADFQATLSGTGIVKSTAGTISYLTDNTANWDTAYNDKINSAAVTGSGTNTLTLTQQDAGTITATWVNGTLIREIRNNTGATLTKGTIVYINGATGNKPTVSKAIATGDSTSAQTFGFVQADIANNANGYVVVVGDLTGVDTSAFNEGDQLYLSSTTAGAFTSTKQYAPAHLVYVGIVTRSHPTLGQIEVNIQNGYEMDELHNVSAQNPSNGDILQYVTSTGLWTKVAGSTTNISEGTNLYYTAARFNSAFAGKTTTDLTEGTNLYFTDARARAAISLTTTGTSGAATYTGGVLNIPQYQAALTNPITGTGTTNYLPKFTTTSSIGNSRIFDNGTSVGIGTATPSASALLEVATTGGTTSTILISGTTGQAQLKLLAGSGASNRATRIDLFNGVASTTIARWTLINDNNQIGTNDLRFISASATALTLTQAGNVGIGTTSPSYKFQTAASVNSDWVGSFYNTSTTTPNGLQVRVGVSSTAQALGVYTDGIGYTFNVLGNGNTLIGTTTDAGYKLDVNGTARVSGQVLVNTGTANQNTKIFGNKVGMSRTSDGAEVVYFSKNTDLGTEGTANINGYDGIQFRTQGAESVKAVITSAGNVGIGTSSPSNLLSVSNNNLSVISLDWIGDNNAKSKWSANHSTGEVQFYNFTNYFPTFYANGSEKMRITSAGQLAVGTSSPDASAKMQIDSTTQGFLVPRMLESEINAISSPAAGLMVYNTDQNHMCMFDGSNWEKFSMSNM